MHVNLTPWQGLQPDLSGTRVRLEWMSAQFPVWLAGFSTASAVWHLPQENGGSIDV